MDDRCPSCGRLLGDAISTTLKGNVVVVRYEIIDADGGRTELEHVCGDEPLV